MNRYLTVRFALAAALTACTFGALPLAGAAGSVPSGEVEFATSRVEPAYNDLDGSFGFLQTPADARIHPNDANSAEIYVIMYPTQVGGTIGGVNCTHQPVDNCPDHGPTLSGLAEAMIPAVYGNGVWGHDHIAALHPGSANSDDGFGINWIPVVVLFNTIDAASTHITTLSQLNAARAQGVVTEVPLPQAAFHGSSVSARVYARGTPVVPVAPSP